MKINGGGFVKIYRDLINQPPFKNRPDIFLFYTWLLVNAPFHSNTLEVRCEELGKIFGKSRITIMNWLRELESEHLLYIKTYNKFTSVTIIPIEIDGNSETSTLHQLDIKVTSETLEPAPILSSEPLKNKEYKKKEKINSSVPEELELAEKIITDLNQKAGKSFKHKNPKTLSFIKARLSEGYTLEDFLKVNQIKTTEWNGDEKMSRYIRPETLYSNKMEGYLNQKPTGKPSITPKVPFQSRALGLEAQVEPERKWEPIPMEANDDDPFIA